MHAKKSRLRNSQRIIFSSQKISGVECGHWEVASCLAVPSLCNPEHTHRIELCYLGHSSTALGFVPCAQSQHSSLEFSETVISWVSKKHLSVFQCLSVLQNESCISER